MFKKILRFFGAIWLIIVLTILMFIVLINMLFYALQ